MGRAPCCDKANVKKGPWSPEEDDKLRSYIHQNGTGGNWIALPQKIGLKRCGKSCRLRWLNYLRPNIRHGGFSEEEDRIIFSLFISIGSRWSIIASQLPGRTDNDVKNYWNTRLKKRLLGKQQQQQRRQPSRPRGRWTVKESAAKVGDDIDGHSIGLNAGMIAGSSPKYPIVDHAYPCSELDSTAMLIGKNPDLAEIERMFSATNNVNHLPQQQQQVYGDPATNLVWSTSSSTSLQPENSSAATGINGFWEEMMRFNLARLQGAKGEDEPSAINSAQLDQNMNWNDEVMSQLMMYPSIYDDRRNSLL